MIKNNDRIGERMNWEKLERLAREALARNAARIESTVKGTPSSKPPEKRKRGKGKRFGAGYGGAS